MRNVGKILLLTIGLSFVVIQAEASDADSRVHDLQSQLDRCRADKYDLERQLDDIYRGPRRSPWHGHVSECWLEVDPSRGSMGNGKPYYQLYIDGRRYGNAKTDFGIYRDLYNMLVTNQCLLDRSFRPMNCKAEQLGGGNKVAYVRVGDLDIDNLGAQVNEAEAIAVSEARLRELQDVGICR